VAFAFEKGIGGDGGGKSDVVCIVSEERSTR
jgi:hypothetical protein